MPVAATKHTADGAKAFAEFFIKTIDWGYATTSSAYMRHYFQPSCVQCRNVATLLDNARRLHDHYLGGRVSQVGAPELARGAPPVFVVKMILNIASIEVIDRNGKAKKPEAAINGYRQSLSVRWIGDRWLIVRSAGR